MGQMRRTVTIALVAAFFIAGLGSCGGGGSNEEVYLHVFNGYPGSSDLSLFGPSGTVASSLPFGQRTNEYVPVDRNLGTEYTMVLNGAPQPFDLELPLYNLYPQESATLFFKRRTETDGFADPILYRHVQTGFSGSDKRCRLVFDNSLSVKNDAIGQFNYSPIMKINPFCTGYVEQIGTYKEAEAQVTLDTGQVVNVGRPKLLQRINKQPWFVPGEVGEGAVLDVRDAGKCDATAVRSAPNASDSNRGLRVADPKSVKFVWTGRDWQKNAAIDFENGAARAPLPTREYMNCIGWNPDKPPGEQEVKTDTVAKCRSGNSTVQTVKLNEKIYQLQFPTGYGLRGGTESDQKIPSNTCGFQMIIASDFFNEFIEQDPDDEFVGDVVTFDPSQYYFWVLYGRPVDPLFEKWGANTPGEGGGFVEVPKYPGDPTQRQKRGDAAAEGGGTSNTDED